MSEQKNTVVPARTFVNAGSRGTYNGAELRPYQGRPNANDALALPSRIANRLFYRDGRVEAAR